MGRGGAERQDRARQKRLHDDIQKKLTTEPSEYKNLLRKEKIYIRLASYCVKCRMQAVSAEVSLLPECTLGSVE